MAGATHPTKSFHPKGASSHFPIRVGGFAQASLTNATIDTHVLDFDCYVRKVDMFARVADTGTVDLKLNTVDAGKNLITPDAAVVNIAGVQQALNSDIVDLKLLRGDKIQMTMNTNATSLTQAVATVWLKPTQ